MLFKKDTHIPAAGDLQLQVDRLEEILTPPTISMAPMDVARDARRRAAAELETVRTESNEVLRRQQDNYPERMAAMRRVEVAEANRKATIEAYAAARISTEEAYLAAVAKKVDEATPILLAVIQLWNEALAPLADLHGHAHRSNLPELRLVAAVPGMMEATRGITALLNAATARAE